MALYEVHNQAWIHEILIQNSFTLWHPHDNPMFPNCATAITNFIDWVIQPLLTQIRIRDKFLKLKIYFQWRSWTESCHLKDIPCNSSIIFILFDQIIIEIFISAPNIIIQSCATIIWTIIGTGISMKIDKKNKNLVIWLRILGNTYLRSQKL